MLFKIVLEKQIRVFDCKQTPSIAAIHSFINKSFPHLKKYTIYYLDEDHDQISLENDSDLTIYLSENNVKPKIYIQKELPEAFDDTVKVQLEKKESEDIRVNPAPPKQEENQNHQAQKQVQKVEQKEIPQKMEKQEKVEKEEQQLAEHPAICDLCGVDIKGDRYKCGVCANYDLCSQCQSTKGHQHPLIKIRLPFQAPISCQLGFSQNQKQEEMKGEIGERLKNSALGKKEKMVYESFIEREQIIISYLGSLLGEDEFNKYKEFSKICKADTYQDLIEEYLTWLEERKGGMEKVMDWIKRQLKALTKFKEEHFD